MEHSQTILERSSVVRDPSAGALLAFGRFTIAAAGAGCAAILLLKVLLAWRINVNWDEFYFLSHVHSLRRGDLDLLFQSAHSHAFQWLAALDGEMNQVIGARLAMLALLALTCVLMFRLARRWVAPQYAVFAPLAYLASSPVLMHGGSFRYDSMLAPLTLLCLLVQAEPSRGLRSPLAAGACFGLMLVISLKAVLLLPVVAVLALAVAKDSTQSGRPGILEAGRFLIVFGLTAGAVAATLLLLHSLALAPRLDDASEAASAMARKSLLDTPLVPRAGYFLESWQWDKATWLLIFGGAFAAIARRKPRILALGLSLLPIVFYRNAFPYYYVVMLAPACVLAALAVESIAAAPREVVSGKCAALVNTAIAAVLLTQAGVHLFGLREDAQAGQRAVLAAVHAIFAQPVPYIDHSGMVATFPKVNFFMSTWGLENYRARGLSFVRQALDRWRPPLLLVNRPVLDPRLNSAGLLPEDRKLLRESYVQYWGPVWLAGADVSVAPGTGAVVKLPFPGLYRLISENSVQVNGVARQGGETVTVAAGSTELLVEAAASATQLTQARFVWAAAGQPPRSVPPGGSLYRPLGKGPIH